jgi:hypothetical protein
MRADTYERHLADGKHWAAAGFLEALHRNGVPLDYLMTNDWHCSMPRVYLEVGKGRIYKRFSDYDFANALKYYHEQVKA